MVSQQPWDLYRAARPLYLVSRALGLAPVRYVRSLAGEGGGGVGLRVSWPAVGYAVVLCCVLFISATLYLTWASLEKYGAILDTKTVLTDVLRTVLTYGSVLGAVGASAALHRVRVGALLARVAAVDRALVADLAALYRASRRTLCALLGAVALLLAAYAVYEAYGVSVDFDQAADWFFHFSLTVYPLVFSAVVDLQFVLATQLLRARFLRVNAYFQALLDECRVRNQCCDAFLAIASQEKKKNAEPSAYDAEVDGRTAADGPAIIDEQLVERVFRDVYHERLSPTRNGTDSTLSQPPGLNTLFRAHDVLCEAVDQVNACFGFQVLLEITCLFVDTICSVYYSVRVSVHRYVHWLLLDMVKIIALATSGHLCTAAANSTAPLISRLLLEPSVPRARRLLSRFSQQLVHARTGLCACGLILLDGGLLAKMAGAVATYIVILMQYKAPVGIHPTTSISVSTSTVSALVTTLDATLDVTTPLDESLIAVDD